MHRQVPLLLSKIALVAVAFGTLGVTTPMPVKSARAGSAFRIVTRSQDDLGVWHVTALRPQQQIVGGKATMVAGSMLARIDCRQRVLRIDAWSLKAPSEVDAEGWRGPGEPSETALLNQVCSDGPQLRPGDRASPPSPSTPPGVPGGERTPPQDKFALSVGHVTSLQYAAQVGIFSTEAAAKRAAAAARAALPQSERFMIDAAPAPGLAFAYRALVRAPSLRDAKAICEAQRRLTPGSTCWVHPIDR